jgi:hypothetical protein
VQLIEDVLVIALADRHYSLLSVNFDVVLNDIMPAARVSLV